jgi:hypothetical protein
VAKTPRNEVEWLMYGRGFPKCINLILKKIKSKDFKKGAVGEGDERTIYTGGTNDVVIR